MQLIFLMVEKDNCKKESIFLFNLPQFLVSIRSNQSKRNYMGYFSVYYMKNIINYMLNAEPQLLQR